MAEKRRKATSTKRKEEISELKAEIRKLRSELELKSELKGLQTSNLISLVCTLHCHLHWNFILCVHAFV
ncbi:hypothetical protein PC118_g8493 [Phytophthora cactorum]|uniref:Uncharacterized protein n=1 Tax=Phytophthora cactorum TaxID=29920 RepID=A0A8T1G8E2_9STRA|nr:hypothetical protein PC118_g8496 [Phytophthora cactorum]KAG2985147.1 hypothetical protein PC118_g8493 [Phytophthora cactorum]